MEAILHKELIINKNLCRTFGVLTFVILTSLGAFVRIPLPFTPVPLTLQTLFVLLSGAILGRNLGVLSQLSYLFLGVLGLPVFTGAGSGLSYLLGPTAGYIFGFIAANFFIGASIRHCKGKMPAVLGVFCIADLIILSMGTIWLKLFLGGQPVRLFLTGFIPFIPGDLLKAFFASLVYLKLKPRMEEIF